MSKRFDRGIWWVKRDFRLDDNDALLMAIEECAAVTAVFVIEPSLCRAPETSLFHYNAWQQAADHLSGSMHARGGKLHVVCGEVVEVLEHIRSTAGFDALYSHEETGSYITFTRDKSVRQWAKRHRIHWHEAHQNGVIRGLKDRDKRQPVIRKRLMKTSPKAAPARIESWQLDSLNSASSKQTKKSVAIVPCPIKTGT